MWKRIKAWFKDDQDLAPIPEDGPKAFSNWYHGTDPANNASLTADQRAEYERQWKFAEGKPNLTAAEPSRPAPMIVEIPFEEGIL